MSWPRSPRWLALPVLAWAGLGMSGCGEFRERTTPPASERAAIDDLVAQVLAVHGLLEHPGDGAALVAAVRIDAITTLLAPGANQPGVRVERAAALDSCAVASADTTSFTACEVGGHTLDGNSSRTAGWIRTELTDVFLTAEGHEGAVTVESSLLRRRGLLHGSLEIYAAWTEPDGAEGDGGLLDATVSCERLAVNEAGCAIGGVLQVSGAFGETLSYSPMSRTISFGPDCGDVTISP